MASNVNMDPATFRSTMSTINQGNIMVAAARNLQKELLSQQGDQPRDASRAVMDMHDLEQDEELEQLHRDRVQQMKREAEKRAQMAMKGHGEYQEVSETEFLPAVTGSSHCVCHFYHNEFERCRIVDKHLAVVARKFFRTRFIKVHAPDAPFFVAKLSVKVLPCLVFFCDGKAYDRIVGFDEFGTRDDFDTTLLEQRMLTAGVVMPPEKSEDSEDEQDELQASRNRVLRRGGVGITKQEGDEDSDFSD